MATISKTVVNTGQWGVESFSWVQINQDDQGEAVKTGGKRQIGSVVASGTFTSATLDLQGSNDGTTYATVDDLSGNAAQLTAAGVIEFQTNCLYYRLFGGGTTLDADCVMILRDT